jgi:universal stress protein A
MAEGKDYLGEKLRLVERAREDVYFRQLDQDLIDKMRTRAAEEAQEASRLENVFNRILVPVDFSPHSTKALLCAADIAERFSSSIIVLHVIPREAHEHVTQQRLEERGLRLSSSAETLEVPNDVLESIVAEHREQCYTQLLEFIPARLATHVLELRVVVGHPFERIVETAVRENVALIVLGTHGRTGLSRVFMGSVAERVSRLAPCPVMTVKSPTHEEEGWLRELYEKVITPTAT